MFTYRPHSPRQKKTVLYFFCLFYCSFHNILCYMRNGSTQPAYKDAIYFATEQVVCRLRRHT